MSLLLFVLRGLIFLGAVLLASGNAAWAKNKLDSLERSAKKACASGDYAKGADILADLYVRTDDATFIFNQGRCYEQNHQWVRAIDRFREYLVKAVNNDHGTVAEVEKHVEKCKMYLSEDEAKPIGPPSAQPQVTVAASPPPPPPPSREAPNTMTVAPLSPPQARTKSPLPAVGIVVGIAGVASLVTAVVLNIKANDYANAGDESNQKSYRNAALGCYGIGAGALTTGIVMYIVGHKNGARTEGVALLPIWTRGGLALALEGGF
jgi:hypothetical protein